MGGASATLRYERPHACPSVTRPILAELQSGKIVFDVYLQQDGGAGAEAASASAAALGGGGGWRGRSTPSLVTGRNGRSNTTTTTSPGVVRRAVRGIRFGVGTGREGAGGRGIGFEPSPS